MKLYKCPWEIGDVFAYKLEGDTAKERGLYGRYLLIQKVDEAIWYPGHIVPIVYVKITKSSVLPTNLDEYNNLEYVQTWVTRYENRFYPIDGRRPLEDIAEKSKIRYEVDEFGYLPNYRITLITKSIRETQKLIYVGNFVKATPPPKEFIPHSKYNICSTPWKAPYGTFETIMLEKYFNYNLRELSIYSNRSNYVL